MAQRFLLIGGSALLASSLAVSSAAANLVTQSQAQAYEVLPWQGCWQADGASSAETLCIVAERSGNMRMITVVNGKSVAESRIIADGRSRPVQQDDCKGSEQARWSSDRQRLFLNSSLTCGENVARSSNGLFVFTGPGEWISIQSVTIGEQTAVRTTRYTAANVTGVSAALREVLGNTSTRTAAADAVLQPVDENDVNEAARYLDPAVVQEWLDVTGLPFGVAGDDDLTTSSQVPYTSALDQVGRMSKPAPQRVREEVVEREVVHHTYVTHVRSCWDPFWGGYCGYRHYGYYSPWGYDYYGWRVWRPIVVINTGHHGYRNHYYRRYDRDDNWRGGRATRDGYRSNNNNGDRDRSRNQYRSRESGADRERTPVRSEPVRVTSGSDPRRTIPRSSASIVRSNNSNGVNRTADVDRSSSSSSSSRAPVVRSSGGRSNNSDRASSPRSAKARSSRGN